MSSRRLAGRSVHSSAARNHASLHVRFSSQCAPPSTLCLCAGPPPPTLQQAGIALAAAAAATALRATTLAAWPAYREASDRSNTQVLSPLTTADVLYVSVLPGLAEELLFRGALLPAVAPDWRGALVAGLVFGALHSSGGRNAAFAAFASVLGCLYGGLMLATGSLWVPAIAHSAANVASAALWKAQHQQQPARK